MKPVILLRHLPLLALGLCMVMCVTPSFADIGLPPKLTQEINPPNGNVSVGNEFSLTFTIQNGQFKTKQVDLGFGEMMLTPDFDLPAIDGLQRTHHDISQSSSINGAVSSAQVISVVATRAGDYTIPTFDITLDDGSVLHSNPIKIHAVDNGNGTAPALNAPLLAPAPNPPIDDTPALPNFNPHGPVVMPPNGPPTQDAGSIANPTNPANPGVPVESDGRPAKVFIVITPQTTEAYVGQSIPLRIEFFLREDVFAQQDSLPTIKGSDFLMNNLNIRAQTDQPEIMDEPYLHQTWNTAISAPKSGDFPLQVEQNTYWAKPDTSATIDPFGNVGIVHPALAHELIGSNRFTIHVRPLPQEGRPANFTGVIGHLKVGSAADPLSVSVGEPVILHFTVGGDGNFDYIHCPTLADDPAWKSYAPRSKIQYQDESQTEGVKFFEQEIVPQKNGSLPLPQASFSYFDPDAKKYVAIPINLPTVTVTGTPLPATATASSTPADNSNPASIAAPQTDALLPNRFDSGIFMASLTPLYHQTWFWTVQVGLLTTVLAGAVFVFVRGRRDPGAELAESLRKQQANSLHQEEAAMKEAVQRGDAQAFFLAARHALQLRLGAQWRLKPEAITLGEIRQRDPALAEALGPLFNQADEVIYSGQAASVPDLAQWERHTRELLQPA